MHVHSIILIHFRQKFVEGHISNFIVCYQWEKKLVISLLSTNILQKSYL